MPQETDLSKHYFSCVKKLPLLNLAEQHLLSKRIIHSSNPDVRLKARNILVERNTLLAAKIARKYARKRQSEDNEIFYDLLGEANNGLIIAADRFDYRYGYKFGTYLKWWVEQSIKKYMSEHSRTVRIPTHKTQLMRKMYLYSRDFSVRNGREPFPDELQNRFACSDQDLDTFYSHEVSLDAQVFYHENEDGVSLLETLVSPVQSPDEQLIASSDNHILEQYLSHLSDKEAHIIKMRYGIGTDQDHTLQSIADEFGITRQRVLQIQKKALRKLQFIHNKAVKNYNPSPPDDSHTSLGSDMLSIRHSIIADYAQRLLEYAKTSQNPSSHPSSEVPELLYMISKQQASSLHPQQKSRIYCEIRLLDEPLASIAVQLYASSPTTPSRLEHCLVERKPLHNLFVQEQEIVGTISRNIGLPVPQHSFDDYLHRVASSSSVAQVQEYVHVFYTSQ